MRFVQEDFFGVLNAAGAWKEVGAREKCGRETDFERKRDRMCAECVQNVCGMCVEYVRNVCGRGRRYEIGNLCKGVRKRKRLCEKTGIRKKNGIYGGEEGGYVPRRG